MTDPTPATAAPDPRAVGAHDCPRCGEPYSLDGCGCPTTTAAGWVCEACGCTEAAHGDDDGNNRTCPHDCTGWFYV